jgi:hypothetical protein
MHPLQISKQQEDFLKKFYHKIQETSQQLRYKNSIKYTIEHCSHDIIEKTTVYRYIPQPIQSWIHGQPQTDTTCRKIHLQIQGRSVSIYIFSFSRYSEKKYQKIVHLMKQWLEIASIYASKTCASHLDIYLYLTPFRKELANMQSRQPLDEMQINTASTTSCMRENSILIFREEEWFKVFIHETFHCLGLDFSDKNTEVVDKKILDLYVGCDPSLDVRFYETYCEIWATIINILFVMVYRGGTSKTRVRSHYRIPSRASTYKRKVALLGLSSSSWNLRYFINSLNKERKYTMNQVAKLLQHYGITYTQLIGLEEITEKYREKTQIFAYYVLKSVIFFSMNDFWKWTEKNGFSLNFPKKTDESMLEFFQLVERNYNNPEFIEELGKGVSATTSMKMTVYGDYFSQGGRKQHTNKKGITLAF